MNSVATRPYRMTARADAAERTGQAIVDAVLSLIPEHGWDEITLEAVAARAGVSVRTVIRRFGSKEGLIAAVGARARELILAQRTGGTPGDLDGIAAELTEHYERWGANALWLLEHRRRVPLLDAQARDGIALHEAWVRDVFAPNLAALGGGRAVRRRRLAQLAAVTDVHTWELLRHRAGLDRRQTELAIRELCAGILATQES